MGLKSSLLRASWDVLALWLWSCLVLSVLQWGVWNIWLSTQGWVAVCATAPETLSAPVKDSGYAVACFLCASLWPASKASSYLDPLWTQGQKNKKNKSLPKASCLSSGLFGILDRRRCRQTYTTLLVVSLYTKGKKLLPEKPCGLERLFQIDYSLHHGTGSPRGAFLLYLCSSSKPPPKKKQKLMSALANGSVFSPVDCAASGVLEASKHNAS